MRLMLAGLISLASLLCILCASVVQSAPPDVAPLLVGFGEVDITPTLGARPVYIAGFGQDRRATGVLDKLFVRALVLRHGTTTVAVASADVVGLFRPAVLNVRKQLPEFSYVLVSSTHNHNGPDTMGLWGPNPFTTGLDGDYLRHVEAQTVRAIRAAEGALTPAVAQIGSVAAPELLHDSRPPKVLHDELVVLQFRDPTTDAPRGIVVQWNCHPETLDSKTTRLSSDYVGTTVEALRAKYGCPVIYLTGTVGGLMTSMRVDIADAAGKRLPEGSVEKTRRYGELLAKRAEQAVASAKPLALTPMQVRSRELPLPVDNPRYVMGKQLGVLDRDMEPVDGKPSVRTEVGWLRLGELDVAVIPGEIYPELVLDRPAGATDPGADFPDAAPEPAIYAQLRGPYRMLVGLGNDELGYILPKRQWDAKPPFTYGLTKAPYGEINSLGPETGPLLCRAFAELVKGQGK